MDKEDARKLSPAEQYERRRQIIRAYKRGRTKTKIAEEIGLSHTAVSKAIARYEAEGMAALAPRTRGRRSGEGRALTVEQESRVRQIICDKRPEQLKMKFALWSRTAVMQLIVAECGVTLHVRSVGKYLARWGFTPQKPIRRACEQSPVAVQAWLEDTYPAIAKRAKQENGEVHWGGETAVLNTDVRGRSVAPRGKTPVGKAGAGTSQKLSMIASVTNQGKARWMIIDGAVKHEGLIEFFESLVKDAGCKVFLIVNNLSVHRCKPLNTWLAGHQAQLEVFYLPGYSPELHPEQRLNGDLKHTPRSKVPVRTKGKSRASTEHHMTMRANKPERVETYLQEPFVKAAA
jgi:transposase